MTSYQRLKNRIEELEKEVREKNGELITLSTEGNNYNVIMIKMKYSHMEGFSDMVWAGNTTSI